MLIDYMLDILQDLDVPLLHMEQCSSLDRSVFIVMAKHFTETDFHGTMVLTLIQLIEDDFN